MDPNQPVSTIMTRNLITVTPETSLSEIKELFDAHPFHHLPVVENGKRLAGILSKEDFLRASYMLSLNTTGKAWSHMEYAALKARDIMTRYPVSLEPDDTIGLAADIFLANKFHALPILDDGEIVGIVTSHDLIRFAFSSPVETTP